MGIVTIITTWHVYYGICTLFYAHSHSLKRLKIWVRAKIFDYSANFSVYFFYKTTQLTFLYIGKHIFGFRSNWIVLYFTNFWKLAMTLHRMTANHCTNVFPVILPEPAAHWAGRAVCEHELGLGLFSALV